MAWLLGVFAMIPYYPIQAEPPTVGELFGWMQMFMENLGIWWLFSTGLSVIIIIITIRFVMNLLSHS